MFELNATRFDGPAGCGVQTFGGRSSAVFDTADECTLAARQEAMWASVTGHMSHVRVVPPSTFGL